MPRWAAEVGTCTRRLRGSVERSLQIESPLTSFPIWQMGGAVTRVGDDETAFNGRTAGFTYNIGAATETSEGFDEEREWVRRRDR